MAAVFGVALVGCAAKKPAPQSLPPSPASAAEPAPLTVEQAPSGKQKAATAERLPLTTTLADGKVAIVRPALRHLVAQGAQSFIAQVDVRPAFRKRRFFGWRVLAYKGPGALRRGDIVVRVNGKGLERPDQFIKVWFSLPDQDSLVVEMVRRGRALTRRFPIIERPKAD